MKSSEFEKHLASLGIVRLPEIKITNLQHIQCMSVEKLADLYFSDRYRYCDCCVYDWHGCKIYEFGLTPEEDCKNAFIKWLNSPIKKE